MNQGDNAKLKTSDNEKAQFTIFWNKKRTSYDQEISLCILFLDLLPITFYPFNLEPAPVLMLRQTLLFPCESRAVGSFFMIVLSTNVGDQGWPMKKNFKIALAKMP